jgi:hypothetical protein
MTRAGKRLSTPRRTAPKIKAEPVANRDLHHAKAFRDLEGMISDCVWMSVIAPEMAGRAIEGREDKHEKAMFAVFETVRRLKQLKADYYAHWNGEVRG